MGLLGKPGGKDTSGKDEILTRKSYSDPSTNFANWVNQLGLEKSWLGRLAFHLEQRWSVRRLSLFFIFTLGLSFLLYFDFEFIDDYSVGEIAPIDIKSPVNLTITDEVATEEKRTEAEKMLPLVFDYEADVYVRMRTFDRIYKSFRTMRNLINDIKWPKSADEREVVIKDFMKHKPRFVEDFGVDVPDNLFEWLVANKFVVRIENILIDAIYDWSNQMIVDLPDSFVRDPDQTVVIRPVGGRGGQEINKKMGDLRNMRLKDTFNLTRVAKVKSLVGIDRKNVIDLAYLLLMPNLTLNKQDFAERQKKARDGVLPVQISIKKNQIIVAKGSPIQPVHLTIIGHIQRLRSEQRTDFLSLFSALLFVTIAVTLFTFLRRYSRNKVTVESKDILVMSIVTIFIVVLTRVILFITESSLLERFGEVIPQTAMIFLAPLAAGPMLIGLIISSVEVVWIFTIFLASVLSVMTDLNVQVFIVAIVGGIAAAQGVFECKTRSDIYKAGFFTGLINAITIVLVYTIQHIGDAELFKTLIVLAIAGVFSGLFSSFIAMTFTPALESLFSYTTDIRLLELSNLNHPLMQEMMMKAPGTYHHAMNVGNMVDAAAKDIGANPLLAKVMALYHDIGKMEHSQYFIENQRRGYNPHDHVSPHMSKTILVAHVKDGAEMAINHKLGKPIVDGILQHHGTTLISYFYNKALEEQDEDTTGTIEESDFRYPGPKPQFKEAALVMLADSIEATARSLEEPTPGRLNSIVENIIESKFMDGQLDECNLTIKDLAEIKNTFKRMLLSMYHQRMDYPHMRDGKAIAATANANATAQAAKKAKGQ